MKKQEIRKLKISYDGQIFRDLSYGSAVLKEFQHPNSYPWEVSITTKNKLSVEDEKVKIHLLTEDDKYFSGEVFVSIENSCGNIGVREYTLKGINDILI